MVQSTDLPLPSLDDTKINLELSSIPVAPELISKYQPQYVKLSRSLMARPDMIDAEEQYLRKDDRVGQTWFRLHHELQEMDAQEGGILPEKTREAFAQVRNAMLGLWLETADPLPAWAIILQKDAKLNKALSDSQPFRDMVRTSSKSAELKNLADWSLRRLIGDLQTELQKKAASLSGIEQQEFQLGLNLAWGKWTTLSTVA